MDNVLVIIVIVGVCLWYFGKKDPNKTIEDLESRAYWLYNMSLEKSDNPIIYNITEDDEIRLKKTEESYIRLKEKFKHDTKKIIEVVIDWRDYCLEMHHKVLEWKKFGVNLESDADKEFEDGIKNSELVMSEIEKRFEKLLVI